ncbi:beta family protein [Prauserella halophila]|uniref:beta family protein n=1 Tax=Prauserella halophila TaxID=185641 RepID=UPI0020A47E8C|nr:beta family protein [Prauserella halophila]MCP2238006.1 Beta protein [Prauserella halophila]
MPHDAHAWVALRAKEGEAEALTHADEAHLGRIQPLMILDQATSAARQIGRAEGVARHLHTHHRVLAVDASDVDRSTFTPVGALGELVDRLSYGVDLFDVGAPIPILPVLREGASARTAADTGRLGEETGTGVALRIRWRPGIPAEFERIVEALNVDPRRIDIVVDLGFIEAVPTEHAHAVHTAVATVRAIGPVRNLVLLSGSVPSRLSHHGNWQQDRYEEQLWREVSARHSDVLFGDYGVVHPKQAPGWPPKNITVRYTCSTGWAYWRRPIEESAPAHEGDGSTDEPPRARTFRKLCRELVDADIFAGRYFSWGDHELSDAAHGNGRALGRSSAPIAFATSHHLAYLATMPT